MIHDVRFTRQGADEEGDEGGDHGRFEWFQEEAHNFFGKPAACLVARAALRCPPWSDDAIFGPTERPVEGPRFRTKIRGAAEPGARAPFA